jgi:hypothetical protein
MGDFAIVMTFRFETGARALLFAGGLMGGLIIACGRVGYEEVPGVVPGALDQDASIDVGFDSGADGEAATAVEPTPDTSFDAANEDGAAEVGSIEAGCSGDACNGCMPNAECSCALYGGHTYWFCTALRNWGDAESQCEAGGMRLARIDDAAENDWVRSSADGVAIAYAWLGIEDPNHTSSWQWVDGTIFWMGDQTGAAVGGLYSDWNAAHPTGAAVRACGGLLSGQYRGQWDDRSCTSLLAYVCEAY